MTTDDLRTRAREAAAILYADPVKDSAAVYTRHALRYYQRGAYEAGFLAHAAQQPSLPHRDELAAVILDATVPFRGPGGQTVPYVQPVHYAMADAVLALFDGADLAAHDREVKAAALREAADRLPGATEGSHQEGTAKWPAHCRDAYSLAIEEAQQVLRAIATNTIESEARP